MTNVELNTAIRDHFFPLDPTRCRRCGWPLKPSIHEGCTSDVCSMVYSGPEPRRYDEPADYATNAVASKQLREKLAEKWDWILGRGKTRPSEPEFGFALYHKNDRSEPMFAAETDVSEELAVARCALQSIGI